MNSYLLFFLGFVIGFIISRYFNLKQVLGDIEDLSDYKRRKHEI